MNMNDQNEKIWNRKFVPDPYRLPLCSSSDPYALDSCWSPDPYGFDNWLFPNLSWSDPCWFAEPYGTSVGIGEGGSVWSGTLLPTSCCNENCNGEIEGGRSSGSRSGGLRTIPRASGLGKSTLTKKMQTH